MPTLTIAVLRDNPWHVLTHDLPRKPSRLLLALAYHAADYCRRNDLLLIGAAKRSYDRGTGPDPETASSPTQNYARRVAQAHDRIREISAFCPVENGMPILQL